MEAHITSWSVTTLNAGVSGFKSPWDMQQKLSQLKELPVLPEIARRIMKLMNDPLSDAKKLAEVVNLDSALTAQVIRWANSPLYGYKGEISSVQTAISHVLGYDTVLSLALGIAAITPLAIPKQGPVGSWRQWQHGLASSYLMGKINRLLPAKDRLEPDLVQLAGLLHNLGFLLLGSQFKDEFNHLNRLLVANPELATIRLEDFAFNTNHTLLGVWLMRAWAMPAEIINVVFHHHNPFYQGDDCVLNRITYYNDCLLGRLGIGDAEHQTCPSVIYEALQISERAEQELLEDIVAQRAAIDQTVNLLVQ